MKQCPKCSASVSDTAKFCVKCGCNIKKFEEENALGREIFCPECGTKFSGGAFCPECGYNASEALQDNEADSNDFKDFFADIEESAATAVEDIMMQEEIARQKKALSVFEYELDGDDEYIILGIKNKNAVKIVIPRGTVAIADGAFEGCEALSVTLPEGLLKIGDAAFKNSKDLGEINLPNSLLYIGDEAFSGCETLDVEIPDSRCKVGKNAFLNTIPYQRAQEAEATRIAEEKKRAQEAEAARIAKEEKRAQEAEAARIAEEEKRAQEAEAARIAEKEKKQKEQYIKKAKHKYYTDLLRNHVPCAKFNYFQYRQSGLFGMKEEKIPKSYQPSWALLDADEEKSLWMCRDFSLYFVDRSRLDAPLDFSSDEHFLNWETSSVRRWLNEVFYKQVLDEQTRSRVITTTLNNGIAFDTQDNVFLLSESELYGYSAIISEYFGLDSSEYYCLRTIRPDQQPNQCLLGFSVNSSSSIETWLLNPLENEEVRYYGSSYDHYRRFNGEREYDRYTYSFLPVIWLKHPDSVLEQIKKDKENGCEVLNQP